MSIDQNIIKIREQRTLADKVRIAIKLNPQAEKDNNTLVAMIWEADSINLQVNKVSGFMAAMKKNLLTPVEKILACKEEAFKGELFMKRIND